MIGPAGNLLEGLLQDPEALAHLERAHHEAIVTVAVIAQRNAKFEPRIKSVAIHFAKVIIHPAGAQHGAGDAGVDRQLGGKLADILCARDDDLVADNQLLELIEESRETIDNLLARARASPSLASTRHPPKRM